MVPYKSLVFAGLVKVPSGESYCTQQRYCTFLISTIVDKSPWDTFLHLCNVTDYLCFRTEVWRKRCNILYKWVAVLPPHPTQCWKSVEIARSSFQHCMGGGVGGEVRQVKLYSRLACTQKRQKWKFVQRLLSMIVDTVIIFGLCIVSVIGKFGRTMVYI